MARIRYIGDQLIARAFERTSHRNHWDEDHGLRDDHVSILKENPRVQVDLMVAPSASSSPEAAAERTDESPSGCRK